MIYVGIDWAEKHHDVCIIDREGEVLAQGRVAEGVDGIARLHELVVSHIDEPQEAIVGIVTDLGLLVERVQGTILEECWKPALARHLIPKYTGLRHDLDRYVCFYNTDRTHNGRHTRGRVPETVIGRRSYGRTRKDVSPQLGDRTH